MKKTDLQTELRSLSTLSFQDDQQQTGSVQPNKTLNRCAQNNKKLFFARKTDFVVDERKNCFSFYHFSFSSKRREEH